MFFLLKHQSSHFYFFNFWPVSALVILIPKIGISDFLFEPHFCFFNFVNDVLLVSWGPKLKFIPGPELLD